ncbi:hypothetical protein [Nocardia brasiliensis]|nr:hypothetical protein [Nocardia brasiliensis]
MTAAVLVLGVSRRLRLGRWQRHYRGVHLIWDGAEALGVVRGMSV